MNRQSRDATWEEGEPVSNPQDYGRKPRWTAPAWLVQRGTDADDDAETRPLPGSLPEGASAGLALLTVIAALIVGAVIWAVAT